MLKALVIVAGLIAAFIAWRLLSAVRGMRTRDLKLLARLEPIGKRLDAGETVTRAEIETLADQPELRHMLFAILRQLQREDLLPQCHLSSADQGGAALAYWMMHPHELQDAPQQIEHVETLRREVDGAPADFHVYRYRMPPGHWAGEGWLLGLAGPMSAAAAPYAERPGAFSRAGDKAGEVAPADLVDWYVDMLRRKGMVK